MQNKNDKIIKVANLLDFQAPVGYNLFQIGCIFAEYELLKPTTSIQNWIYKFLYNFDTVLYQFLVTGTSDRCLIGIVQRLRFSGFILYPLSFFLYSPFKCLQLQ